MPKRDDIKSVLILGAGPIVIGQACEFDYSGAQACKALKEEGLRVILVNSNPATIMTDPSLADATYIEPVEWQTVAKIIAQERPCAILPTMGGQTALNCALDLDKQGVLAQFNVKMIGANACAINKAEDRFLFDKAMKNIGLECPRSGIAHNMQEAMQVAEEVGFPCIIRPSFTMGGTGGGIAYNLEEFAIICARGLDLSPTNELLIDESLIGWKEYEMEVVRDVKDNCIIVCTIENFDAMGVHTGDSITVAPAQTLTDKELQIMRNAAIAVLREIGVETGGSNVQFGIHPQTGRMVIIEMNPRVSRSSALASKATGFPIAKIATKLALGYSLDELANDITGKIIPASFEPALDYVVTKIPRFAFEKFPQANARLTTQMKSVGEVMAIGRTFAESLQKAIRSLEIGSYGFEPQITQNIENWEELVDYELANPSAQRLWYVADAFRLGKTPHQVHALTHIDPWFLAQIANLVQDEQQLSSCKLQDLTANYLRYLKRNGFSDIRIAQLLQVDEQKIRSLRQQFKVTPVYKRVDTCAAEFATNTAYMYSTYEQECEAHPTNKAKIMILGGGPNRIGQGIEFDYCCVHASLALREDGFETIMVNCNPETVSTDYDISDRLYFEPITVEDVLAIVEIEKPQGVIVHYGGQTPLKISQALADAGVPIIGTTPQDIDCAEDRAKFNQIMDQLNLLQPQGGTATSEDQALQLADELGYPLMVRPSYVLGGRAMEIVYNHDELKSYITHAVKASDSSPVLLDRFLEQACEVDIDAICDGKNVVIGGVMQHIEQAGVHSGDSACSLPPYSLNAQVQKQIRRQVQQMALALNVRGLLNVQMAVVDEKIYVLEVNPRASRTVPFVSKAIGVSIAAIAAKVMAGKSLAQLGFTQEVIPSFFNVKEAVFPFNKFGEVDPILGPEMKSTGEVMGIGKTFSAAFAKAVLGAGDILPTRGTVFISVQDADKKEVISIAAKLLELGFKIVATSGTAEAIKDGLCSLKANQTHNIKDLVTMADNIKVINKVRQGRPHIVDLIKNKEINLIINTTYGRKSIADSSSIRRNALAQKIYYTTTLAGARATIMAMQTTDMQTTEDNNIYSLQELHSWQS